MGLKRKASTLESDAFDSYHQSQWPQRASFNIPQRAHQPSSPPSLTSDSASPGSSPSSMDTEPFHTQSLASEASYFTHVPNAPWLHTRTRKRVRDNRPSESQIHDATMRRLFDAQRTHYQHHHTMDDAPMMDGGMPMHMDMMEPAILPERPDGLPTLLDNGAEMELEAAMMSNGGVGGPELGGPEANQRSIHDFFARQKGKERECVPVTLGSNISMSMPMSVSVPVAWGCTETVLEQPPLKERRSFGVLGDMNRGNVPAMAAPEGLAGPLLTPGGVGSCLPCDFRPAEAVHAMMEDAMVMG